MIERLGLLTPRYPPTRAGGGEQSVQLLAEQLAQSDRIGEITVFSFDGTETSTVGGVTIRRLEDVSSRVTELQNVAALRRIRRWTGSVNLIHAYNMELNPLVGYLSARDAILSVATLNSYHFLRAQKVNRVPDRLERLYELVGYPTTGRILRYYQRQTDQFVAISDAIKRIYTDHGLPADRITTVPNMYDPAFEPPPLTEASDPYSLIYVGELTRKKGVHVLLRAMAQLPAAYQLRIVGTGPHEAEFRTLARELDLTDRVEFTGRIPYEQIGASYADASLFVHPGIIPEAFGRTIIEAMQSGLPVVCTDVGGPPDIVLDSALVCASNSAEALAAAILQADSVDREPAAYREYVEENFAPQRVTEQMIDVYETVVSAD
jgi:glycosyltransferase involved in cell wall biosynthesis